ncbi:MAG: Mut7-C ubiquitin/RNAse domain-containing protein [FCB group bacterium]|nr:Mut7-C ubiquitin/RNAse domain-containing protein [FCB group bacterium]
MVVVYLRFYEELNDFLAPERRKVRFEKQLLLPTTVKDLIQSCGVPHTEVDLILVNGESVDFDYLVKNQDDISVYPVFESLDISDVTRLQERPLRKLSFTADSHLGKLARRLRLLGLDVTFDRNIGSRELVKQAVSQKRVLLTRNRQLLMPNVIQRGYCVRSDQADEQAMEVIRRFDLGDSLNPFSRCLSCNGMLEPVPKEEILHRLPPMTKETYERFFQCQNCHKIYWPGSHFEKLNQFVEAVYRCFATGERPGA